MPGRVESPRATYRGFIAPVLQDISGASDLTGLQAQQKRGLLEPSVVRIVAHVDMDAFYAAVEERYHPELRGRPVVVGADPKGGRGRGVVTAANYAARKYGIRSALPISRAWRLAESARRKGEPEVVFVRGDRSLYREVSGRIMAIIARGADAFEEASIDEAYVDLSSLGGMQEAEAHARRLKDEILAQEGLTCSIGIGPNKLMAKIASDFQKPDGQFLRIPEAIPARSLGRSGSLDEAAHCRSTIAFRRTSRKFVHPCRPLLTVFNRASERPLATNKETST